MTHTEVLAAAYWDAFRDGYVAVGGKADEYPTWEGFRAVPEKAETMRCLRHAIEALALHNPALFNAEEYAKAFPDAPVPRVLYDRTNDEKFLRQVALTDAFSPAPAAA